MNSKSKNKDRGKGRRIWEKAYGKVPKGFSIHHRDLDHTNNDLSNLQLVTYQQHVDLHMKAYEETGDMKHRKGANVIAGYASWEDKYGPKPSCSNRKGVELEAATKSRMRMSNNDRIEVVNLHTGEVYPSIKFAAECNGIAPRTLNRWLLDRPDLNKSNLELL